LNRLQQFWRRNVLALFLSAKALISPMAFGVNALVVDKQGRVLLVRHTYMPGWQLPGGGVDRGEPPDVAILRELKEEIGLSEAAPPELIGIFTRRLFWIGNVIALYRIVDAKYVFKPNGEIREMTLADPANPPEGLSPATKRRLAELANNTLPSPYW
jgi:8-oxo-dGTP pyrophosphatase MutT (NUDIX family)